LSYTVSKLVSYTFVQKQHQEIKHRWTGQGKQTLP